MKKQLRSYGIITVGSVIFALSFDWFFAANAVGMGGITGLAQVLNVLFPALSVGIGTILLNVPLFLAGWKFIGFHLLASSLFSMTVSSLAMDGIALLYTFSPMDPMLASICGGAMMGAGLGIVFSQGATTGGTDIVARLLKLKFPWLPMGKLILIPDGVVLALTAIAFQRLETALYGAVALYVSSKVMDTVLYGLNETRPSQDKDDEQEVFYTTALAQDQADGYVLTGHPVMLQGGEYVMFTYEGLGTGVQEFILTVYGTCMPMLNLTRRKGQDIERYYPAEDAKAGDRPINLRCELLIPIRR